MAGRLPSKRLRGTSEGSRMGPYGRRNTGAYSVTDERLTLRQAAARLGVSESAIRKRVERRTLRSDMGPDGRRYVYLDTVADKGADTSATGERDALISEMVEELRAEVHYLRDQLHQELGRRS